MSGQNGIHNENIKIGSMIGNNHVRTLGQTYSFQTVNPDPAKQSNTGTPNHINGETPFFPGIPQKSQIKEWVKE
ncbi:MAG: hypothetical protein K0S23_2471 [Fluviicola sp.]|jgi:hypothetical protein|nr:hypothetical protein [Fluviicola sp.]